MTTERPRTVEELRERLDASWQAFRTLVHKLTPEELRARIDDGRTVLEALAGVAFWNETCAPVFAWMRGEPAPPVEEWYGGGDLGLGEGDPWPRDDVHHVREAAWARSVGPEAVRSRLDDAYARLVATVATLTPEDFRPGSEPGDQAGIDPEHPWATLSNQERMIAKAVDCGYRLYDDYTQQITAALR